MLERYVFFYKYLEKDRSKVIPSKSMPLVIENIEDPWTGQYKSALVDIVQSFFLWNRIPLTFESVVKHVFSRMLVYAGDYRDFSYFEDEDGHICLVFQHDYDEKWSRILESVYCALIKDLFGYTTKSNMLSSHLVIKILEKSVIHQQLTPELY